MSVPVVRLRWSSKRACGADSAPGDSLVPPRGGVYELLHAGASGLERAFVGQTDDLASAFASHSKSETRGVFFRYWEQPGAKRRREVVSALSELHAYSQGHDDRAIDTGCIQLVESEASE